MESVCKTDKDSNSRGPLDESNDDVFEEEDERHYTQLLLHRQLYPDDRLMMELSHFLEISSNGKFDVTIIGSSESQRMMN